MSLRRFRIFFSSILLLLFTAVFLGFDINEKNILSTVMTFFQFLPAVIEFLSTHAMPALTGIIFVIILTILFGRIYCSFLCPLGALSDVFIFISGRRKKRFSYKKPVPFVRPFMIILIIVSLVSGSMLAVNIFDPYSYFGRIAADLIKPAALFVNNSISSVLSSFKLYILTQKLNHTISIFLAGFTAFSLILIIVFAVLRGRLYCNTLCPVGAILGYISKISLFKIKLDESKCTSCGKCGNVCKAECINSSENNIDYSRCIMCFICIDVCKFDAVKLQLFSSMKTFNKEKTILNSINRKSFLSKAGRIAIAAGLYQVLPLRNLFADVNIIRKSKLPITPPGSISVKRFTSLCTACHLCVSRCPGGVLQPAFLEYGLSGIFQPLMDYKKGFCEYECKICLDVCPNSAITSVSIEKKKMIKIGKSILIKEDCVVYKNFRECGACIEVCPTRSVYPVLWKGIIAPEVEDRACIGCGACERACPVIEKAIYVEGLEYHAIAEPRKEKSIDLKKDKKLLPDIKKSTDDFPF